MVSEGLFTRSCPPTTFQPRAPRQSASPRDQSAWNNTVSCAGVVGCGCAVVVGETCGVGLICVVEALCAQATSEKMIYAASIARAIKIKGSSIVIRDKRFLFFRIFW